MRLEHHSTNQHVWWRHTWRCTYDNGNVSEFDALEYRPGAAREVARQHSDQYVWIDGTPWRGDAWAFHSATPLYPGQQPIPGACLVLGAGQCFYDADTRIARAMLRAWALAKCDNTVVWQALRGYDDAPNLAAHKRLAGV